MKFTYSDGVLDFTSTPSIFVGFVPAIGRWCWRVRVEGVESLRGTAGTEAEAWSEARACQRNQSTKSKTSAIAHQPEGGSRGTLREHEPKHQATAPRPARVADETQSAQGLLWG